jgi:hypothetical protein
MRSNYVAYIFRTAGELFLDVDVLQIMQIMEIMDGMRKGMWFGAMCRIRKIYQNCYSSSMEMSIQKMTIPTMMIQTIH